MNETIARRLTGIAGISAAAALIVEVPLYFLYSGPPPASNVLARLLIGILALGVLVIFVTAFRELVKRVSPQYEWAGTLAFASGLVYATITLVSSGLEAGAVIAADHPVDPTITVNGTYILYGTISRMMLGIFLASVGFAISRTRLLPPWTCFSAYALAAINVAFMPSLFFGNDPAHFYAANGWGTTALMGALLSYWLLALGVSVVRSASRVAPATATAARGH
ncbi:hypothetical protein [Streptomyces sp. NBC_01497]|uniref:hypothetical protein n=1 Tax=Streptomyces sp. NBC_01497 TaxID=2903885 RepID=UPI002E3449D2|nr:hypothetical protein [Streptomyces sp. NBC_01497]